MFFFSRFFLMLPQKAKIDHQLIITNDQYILTVGCRIIRLLLFEVDHAPFTCNCVYSLFSLFLFYFVWLTGLSSVVWQWWWGAKTYLSKIWGNPYTFQSALPHVLVLILHFHHLFVYFALYCLTKWNGSMGAELVSLVHQFRLYLVI